MLISYWSVQFMRRVLHLDICGSQQFCTQVFNQQQTVSLYQNSSVRLDKMLQAGIELTEFYIS